MHKTIIATLCCLAVIQAEPPPPGTSSRGKAIVSQRLLNRVADIIANGGDSSSRDDGIQENEGPSVVDQELLDRIARIISQNDGQLSWAHKGHGVAQSDSENFPPSSELSLPSNNNEVQLSYGIPPVEAPAGAKELAGTLFELSPPERVPRIASFDFTDADEENNIGFSSSPVQQDSYAANGNLFQGRANLRIDQAESALRIASFDIEGQQPPPPYTPSQGGFGISSRYSTLGHSHK